MDKFDEQVFDGCEGCADEPAVLASKVEHHSIKELRCDRGVEPVNQGPKSVMFFPNEPEFGSFWNPRRVGDFVRSCSVVAFGTKNLDSKRQGRLRFFGRDHEVLPNDCLVT